MSDTFLEICQECGKHAQIVMPSEASRVYLSKESAYDGVEHHHREGRLSVEEASRLCDEIFYSSLPDENTPERRRHEEQLNDEIDAVAEHLTNLLIQALAQMQTPDN